MFRGIFRRKTLEINFDSKKSRTHDSFCPVNKSQTVEGYEGRDGGKKVAARDFWGMSHILRHIRRPPTKVPSHCNAHRSFFGIAFIAWHAPCFVFTRETSWARVSQARPVPYWLTAGGNLDMPFRTGKSLHILGTRLPSFFSLPLSPLVSEFLNILQVWEFLGPDSRRHDSLLKSISLSCFCPLWKSVWITREQKIPFFYFIQNSFFCSWPKGGWRLLEQRRTFFDVSLRHDGRTCCCRRVSESELIRQKSRCK